MSDSQTSPRRPIPSRITPKSPDRAIVPVPKERSILLSPLPPKRQLSGIHRQPAQREIILPQSTGPRSPGRPLPPPMSPGRSLPQKPGRSTIPAPVAVHSEPKPTVKTLTLTVEGITLLSCRLQGDCSVVLTFAA